MADYTTTWYVNAGNQSTTGYYAVAQRQPSTAVVAGKLVRQFAKPPINDERVFVCIVAGTTSAAADATWSTGRGTKTTDGSVTWMECTGIGAVNGDAANTPTWSAARAIDTLATLGTIVKRNNGASYQICQTAGVIGTSEPAFSNTAGVTTTDGSVSWISLGPVGNFVGGGAPHARIASAFRTGWFGDGDTVYVGDNHAESQATAIDWGPFSQGDNVNGGRLLCHNHAGPYPPTALATGATVSTTANVNFTYQMIGTLYVYGITFKAGVGLTSGFSYLILTPNAGSYLYFDKCSFRIEGGSPGAPTYIQIGGTGVLQAMVVFNNCTTWFFNPLNGIVPASGAFIWQNTGPVLEPGSATPTALLTFGPGFSGLSAAVSSVTLEALDLSQVANLTAFNLTNVPGYLLVKDCKLNASLTVGPPHVPGGVIQFVRSGSDSTGYYTSTKYSCDGTETTETSITRVGGSIDPTNQRQSRKIVTTANPQWQRPFFAEPYAIWNATVGKPVSITVLGAVPDDVVPNNDDIWLEIEYMGSTASPLGTTINTTKADFFAPSAPLASDASVWSNAPDIWSAFKMTATLSSPPPGLPGYIHVRVRAAKPNTTYYVDPQVYVS
jgi:hypothetical protein